MSNISRPVFKEVLTCWTCDKSGTGVGDTQTEAGQAFIARNKIKCI